MTMSILCAKLCSILHCGFGLRIWAKHEYMIFLYYLLLFFHSLLLLLFIWLTNLKKNYYDWAVAMTRGKFFTFFITCTKKFKVQTHALTPFLALCSMLIILGWCPKCHATMINKIFFMIIMYNIFMIQRHMWHFRVMGHACVRALSTQKKKQSRKIKKEKSQFYGELWAWYNIWILTYVIYYIIMIIIMK